MRPVARKLPAAAPSNSTRARRKPAVELLAFVHADTIVPASFAADIEAAMRKPAVAGGRFDLALDDPALPYRLIGWLISLRSRISRTATGDQAIFVRREIFERLGGFPNIEICEDLDFARRLKRAGKVACLRSRVITSARRWQRSGLLRTVLRMWLIRLSYLAGVPPASYNAGTPTSAESLALPETFCHPDRSGIFLLRSEGIDA